MGAWAGQPNIGGMQPQQQGSEDVPAFDLPPSPQMPGVGGQGPMPPQPQMPGFMPPQPTPRDPSIDTLPNHHNMMFLRDLYQQELGRESDKGGMNHWQQQMANGMSRDQIRQMFDQSEEGQAYNRLPGNGSALYSLYNQELGRSPDSEGMNYWMGQLQNGMSMDQIRQMFDQSQEGQTYNQQPPRVANDPRNPHLEEYPQKDRPTPEDSIRGIFRNHGYLVDQGTLDNIAGRINSGDFSMQQLNDWARDYYYNMGPGPLHRAVLHQPQPQPMHPEIEDALRLANQRGQQSPPEGRFGGGVGGPHMPSGQPPMPQYTIGGQGLPQGQNISQAMGLLRSLGVM